MYIYIYIYASYLKGKKMGGMVPKSLKARVKKKNHKMC